MRCWGGPMTRSMAWLRGFSRATSVKRSTSAKSWTPAQFSSTPTTRRTWRRPLEASSSLVLEKTWVRTLMWSSDTLKSGLGWFASDPLKGWMLCQRNPRRSKPDSFITISAAFDRSRGSQRIPEDKGSDHRVLGQIARGRSSESDVWSCGDSRRAWWKDGDRGFSPARQVLTSTSD